MLSFNKLAFVHCKSVALLSYNNATLNLECRSRAFSKRPSTQKPAHSFSTESDGLDSVYEAP
jgi:hypothetical protein